MDFGLTEEQTELGGLTRKILAERDAPWGDLAAAGVLAAGLPLSLGGAGLGLLEQCSVLLTAALAEEDGDDPRVPSARAERADGQWVLSGVKTAVDAAPEADLF